MSSLPSSAGTGRPAGPPDPETLPPTQRARRDGIVRAAIDLLDGAEYDDVQMRNVAERAGVALGTLYRYFSSKEHLYAAALLAWSSDYGQPPRAVAVDDLDDEARLRAILRRAVKAFERSPQMLRVQLVVNQSSDPNAAALYAAFSTASTAVMTSALHDVDPAVVPAVINTVQGVLWSWLGYWALGRCPIREVDATVQDAIDLIFGGPPVTVAPS